MIGLRSVIVGLFLVHVAFADVDELDLSNNIFIKHMISARAAPFRAPTYLPPVEALTCRGQDVCVQASQCQNGYFSIDLPSTGRTCDINTEVCCAYKPKPTPQSFTDCSQPTHDCVSVRSCQNGEIAGPVGYVKQKDRCYAPEVCCRIPVETTVLKPDGYHVRVPEAPLVIPTPRPTVYVPQTPRPTVYVPQTPRPTVYVPQTPRPTIYVPPVTPAPTVYVPKTQPPIYLPPSTPRPTVYVPPVTPAPTVYVPKTQPPIYLPPSTPRPTVYVPPVTPAPTVYVPKTQPPIYLPPSTPRPTVYVPPRTPAPTIYVPTTRRPIPTTNAPIYLPPQPQPYQPQPSKERPVVIKPTGKPQIYEDIKSEPIHKPRPIQPRPTGDIISRPIIPSPQLPPSPSCSAALKCTPIEYCTATGVISKSPVELTPHEQVYRTPLTDCNDEQAGIINGKCCRDPDYVDPWPTSLLASGRYDPSLFQ